MKPPVTTASGVVNSAVAALYRTGTRTCATAAQLYRKNQPNNQTKMSTTKLQPLIVTTAHKGVFFGYGVNNGENTIRIERARMCVYWSADVKGVVGLAATGPTKGCRI